MHLEVNTLISVTYLHKNRLLLLCEPYFIAFHKLKAHNNEKSKDAIQIHFLFSLIEDFGVLSIFFCLCHRVYPRLLLPM